MIAITEPKIAGLTPRWARFPGFSLLFDAPGNPYRPENGVETLACDVDEDPALGFFRRVLQGLDSLNSDRLLHAYGLCTLPTSSYHVTAFDVANVADLSRCHASVRDGLRTTLDRLPASAAFDDALLDGVEAFAAQEWNLTFGFGDLCHWGGAIVVRLEPHDDGAFGRFVAEREALSQRYRQALGVGASESYTPHLSLGYFMNSTGAELATARRQDWNDAVRSVVDDATITFKTASLYGFVDMATFFRRNR